MIQHTAGGTCLAKPVVSGGAGKPDAISFFPNRELVGISHRSDNNCLRPGFRSEFNEASMPGRRHV